MGKAEPPLKPMQKFLCALGGALTFFVVSFFGWTITIPGLTSLVFLGFGVFMVALAVSIPALFISWVISWRNERHGPIRLFLTGIILPALASVIIRVSLFPWMEFSRTLNARVSRQKR